MSIESTVVADVNAAVAEVVNLAKKFKSRMGAIVYIMKNGKPANFVEGEFVTSVPSEIAELDDEVANGHPIIYIDGGDSAVVVAEDPMAGLKANMRAQILAEIAATPEVVTLPTANSLASLDSLKVGNITSSSSQSASTADSNSGANK